MGKIRLLLALSVVAAHGGLIWKFNLVGGQIAVQSFFIISGFYMSIILNEKYIGANSSYKLFITNRLLRLYPIYWAVLILSILGSLAIAVMSHGTNLSKFQNYIETKPSVLTLLYLIFTNVFIFGQDVIMFLGINPVSGNMYFTNNFYKTNPPLWSYLFIPPAWTLGLELTFYIIAPFILRKGIKIVLLGIVLSFLLRLITYNYFNLHNDPWSYRFFPTEIMFFLIGYLSYKIYLGLSEKKIPSYLNEIILWFLIIFMVLYFYLPDTSIHFIPFSVKEMLFFFTIIFAIPILFKFQKNNKLDNQIGELSYPVYIVHWLIVSFCTSMTFIPKAGWIIVVLTFGSAYILNKFIAYPIEKFRQSRLRNGIN